MTKLEKTIMIGMTTLLILILGVIVFISVYPFKIQTAEQPFEVLTPQVIQGGTLGYRLHFQKHINAEAQVDRSLICDSYDPITVSNGFSNYPKGEVTRLNYLAIPLNTPVGTCYLRILVNYQLYGIRTVTYDYRTTDFIVTSRIDGVNQSAPVISKIPSTIVPENTTTTTTNNTTNNTTTGTVTTPNKGVITKLLDKVL